MKRSLLTKTIASIALLLGTVLTGCNTEKVTFDSPEVSVSQTTIDGISKDGGTVEFTVKSNRSWKVVVPEDIDWIMPVAGFDKGDNDGSVKLALLPNTEYDREATVKVATTTAYAAVKVIQKGAKVRTDIYWDNFNNGTAISATTAVADYKGWNKMGLGSPTVVYSATGADVRSTRPFAPGTPNNIFFPAAGADFIIHNISKGDATNMTFDCYVDSYSEFVATALEVSYSTSAAPETWINMNATRATTAPGYVVASGSFTVDAAVPMVSIKVTGKDIRLFEPKLWAEGTINITELPSVTTESVDAASITKTSASLTGKFTYAGAATIAEVGVAYCDAAATVQTYTNVAATGSIVAGATFTSTISGLTAGTTYNYKAYAKIGTDYYYGVTKQFATLDAGTLLYLQTFGTTALSSGSYQSIQAYTGFETTGAGSATSIITGTAGETVLNVSVRTPNASLESQDYPGASGKSSAYFGGDQAVMYIYNVATGGEQSLKLSLGSSYTGNDAAWLESFLKLSYSTDNLTWLPLTYVRDNASTAKSWKLTTATITLAAAAPTVSIKIASGIAQLRLDDVKLLSAAELTVTGGVKFTSTVAASAITPSAATVGGEFTNLGGAITSTGVAYRKATEAVAPVELAATGVASPISVTLSSLAESTDYTYVPFAKVGSAVYYGEPKIFTTQNSVPASQVTIAALRAKTPATVLDVNEYVEGVVISDISTSMINAKSIVIQEGTAINSGITLRIKGATHAYKAGDKVKVLLDGGKVAVFNNLTQFEVASDDKITLVNENNTVTPVEATVSQLTSYESMLVSVADVQVAQSSLTKATVSGATNMVSNLGGEFAMYIPSGANFATTATPTGMGALIGIASINGTTLQMLARSASDFAALTATRFMDFGAATFTAITFKAGSAVADGKITIPYYGATAAGSITIDVTASGAGAGVVVPATASYNYAVGNGNIEIAVTGTPTTDGAVTFELTAAANAMFGKMSCTGVVLSAGPAVTYTRVATGTAIGAGDYVIVGNTTTESGFAMNSTVTTFFAQTAVTIATGGVISNPDASVVWTIAVDVDGLTISNGGKFVSYTGSSNNAQFVDAVSSNDQRWSISAATEKGDFKIANVALPTRLLQYNATSTRFACYTGTQNNLLLFKKDVVN